jgi:hypothetical protein
MSRRDWEPVRRLDDVADLEQLLRRPDGAAPSLLRGDVPPADRRDQGWQAIRTTAPDEQFAPIDLVTTYTWCTGATAPARRLRGGAQQVVCGDVAVHRRRHHARTRRTAGVASHVSEHPWRSNRRSPAVSRARLATMPNLWAIMQQLRGVSRWRSTAAWS